MINLFNIKYLFIYLFLYHISKYNYIVKYLYLKNSYNKFYSLLYQTIINFI